MGDLRYRTVLELEVIKCSTEERISSLKSQIAGQQERLKWVNQYIFEKTPREMIFDEIERALGHKVIIK